VIVAEKIGDTLGGRYVLLRQLAIGGTARILEAEDTKLGRNVAIKLLSPNVPKEFAQRLEREGRLAGTVAHPNVCALLDAGETKNGSPFLVFELLRGQTLGDRMDQGPVPLADVMRLAEQLLAALGAAHERGIVHRDVKPTNIFLSAFLPGVPLLKLLDFGTAQMPGDDQGDGVRLTSTGMVVGTVEYMAPEQVRGLRDFDARTDIYACGVVLFELLAGRRPFDKLPIPDLLQVIGFSRAPSLQEFSPHVPRPIVHAIDVALATQREHRHADVGSFLAALRSTTAPPTTAATNVLRTGPKAQQATTGSATDAADWDLKTWESAPPESALKVEDAESDPSLRPIARPKR
jgi:serine/threonine-protein kinase